MTALSSSTPSALVSPPPYSFSPEGGQQPFSFKKPPLLLLKTRSSPVDGYEEFFAGHRIRTKELDLGSGNGSEGGRKDLDAEDDGDDAGVQLQYHPVFIPVLEHRFHEANLRKVKEIFVSGGFNSRGEGKEGGRVQDPGQEYGGLIFTSQRAVEAFGKMLEDGDDSFRKTTSSSSPSLVLYTVGPATSRALKTIRDTFLPHAKIHGKEAGNGENLAHMILDHYPKHLAATNTTSAGTNKTAQAKKPALLFLVGEQRRDIIPKTLMSQSFNSDQRIQVDELVVYETGQMVSFENDFRMAVAAGEKYFDDLHGHCRDDDNLKYGHGPPPVDGEGAADKEEEGEDVMWVVVFSPTGCDAMLRVLGRVPSSSVTAGSQDEAGKSITSTRNRSRRCLIATIGPTTRDHLRSKYGVEPEVCAETPSPEGVGMGIANFMRRTKQT